MASVQKSPSVSDSSSSTSSVQFTVGKLDAGMAMLLTEENHLIEFPSLLLPSGVGSGSIVNIEVRRNTNEEAKQRAKFEALQEEIMAEFGTREPQAPVLKVRSATQTSVTLEWEPLQLAAADLHRLVLYRDGAQSSLHIPLDHTMCKVSGLDVNHAYKFSLDMKTSAGTYASNTVNAQTHALENLTGIHVAFGDYESEVETQSLRTCLQRIGAQWSSEVSLDSTHLLCRTPRGPNYEKAVQLNIPIVKPDWLIACETNKKLQPALSYYLT
ncbi:hypothetical protein H4R33_001260 [Dimargaris cristalligena]|uniref:BRCT domain-containing protein n=1 Tax=Dimargaris cristalligena TaxID=215637 RepID=A0A4P9ZT24_9FUNG|nr:hypothetical protein H4R33_001260 [Dimargaris cristalligena]RKP36653.1 hypothetical protein BJ085DRAFT_16390 [Dimargaris cristalligena]|eukprot:RKP36653.1 hypothetical protein BJ085DRAFT_16390 [Dimargaris cristalligena]